MLVVQVYDFVGFGLRLVEFVEVSGVVVVVDRGVKISCPKW